MENKFILFSLFYLLSISCSDDFNDYSKDLPPISAATSPTGQTATGTSDIIDVRADPIIAINRINPRIRVDRINPQRNSPEETEPYITLTGRNFPANPRVRINQRLCRDIRVNNTGTEITCQIPLFAAEGHDVARSVYINQEHAGWFTYFGGFENNDMVMRIAPVEENARIRQEAEPLYDQNVADVGDNNRVIVAPNGPGMGFDLELRRVDIYDDQGFNEEGFNREGFNAEGIHRDTRTRFNPLGLTVNNERYFDGRDQNDFDQGGFDQLGRHRNGTEVDQNGYNVNGFRQIRAQDEWLHRNGTNLDNEGFNYIDDGLTIFTRTDERGFNKNCLTENTRQEQNPEDQLDFTGLPSIEHFDINTQSLEDLKAFVEHRTRDKVGVLFLKTLLMNLENLLPLTLEKNEEEIRKIHFIKDEILSTLKDLNLDNQRRKKELFYILKLGANDDIQAHEAAETINDLIDSRLIEYFITFLLSGDRQERYSGEEFFNATNDFFEGEDLPSTRHIRQAIRQLMVNKTRFHIVTLIDAEYPEENNDTIAIQLQRAENKTCIICSDNEAIHMTSQEGCASHGRNMCYGCLLNHVRIQACQTPENHQRQISCPLCPPSGRCQVIIDPEAASNILYDQHSEELQECGARRLEKHLGHNQRQWHFCQSNLGCIDGRFLEGEDPFNHRLSCRQCRQNLRLATPDPLDEQHVRELLQAGAEMGGRVRPCPHCNTPIERIDGCSSMRCTSCNQDYHFHFGTLEQLRQAQEAYDQQSAAGPVTDERFLTNRGTYQRPEHHEFCDRSQQY